MFTVATAVDAQNRDVIKPPPDTATLAESQKWLIDSFTKFGSFKTPVQTVTISNVNFDGCTFNFAETRKSGSVSTATMGATRTISTAKGDVSIDLGRLSADGVKVTDHIYPELRTIELTFAGDPRIVEIVVKSEASDAFKTVVIQIGRLCNAKN